MYTTSWKSDLKLYLYFFMYLTRFFAAAAFHLIHRVYMTCWHLTKINDTWALIAKNDFFIFYSRLICILMEFSIAASRRVIALRIMHRNIEKIWNFRVPTYYFVIKKSRWKYPVSNASRKCAFKKNRAPQSSSTFSNSNTNFLGI